jgi:DNA-binding response OmpR family regulator
MPASRKLNKTILIVDDEERDLNKSRRILLGEGYTVLEADCYRRAISVAGDNLNRVHLLVADVSLPDGDACDLALQLRDRQPDLRVLFVSAHAGAEVCRFYGLDQTNLHFLRKPFTAKQLSDRVQRVLNTAEPFPQLHRKYWTA